MIGYRGKSCVFREHGSEPVFVDWPAVKPLLVENVSHVRPIQKGDQHRHIVERHVMTKADDEIRCLCNVAVRSIRVVQPLISKRWTALAGQVLV